MCPGALEMRARFIHGDEASQGTARKKGHRHLWYDIYGMAIYMVDAHFINVVCVPLRDYGVQL
jgi:hypothetical protein